MRVVVTGATGNLGSAVVAALGRDPEVHEVIGVARRLAHWRPPKVSWVAADVARSDLAGLFAGADAVVHLAWELQPSHRHQRLWTTNVHGTQQVLAAVRRAGTPAAVFASSIGTYAPSEQELPVDETWPATGIATSAYSMQKAMGEAVLARCADDEHGPDVSWVRPALVTHEQIADQFRRFWLGPPVPSTRIPMRAYNVLPFHFQAVHADDVADAIRRMLHARVRGPYNLAAPGVLGQGGTEPVQRALRRLVQLGWTARLTPVDPGWIELLRHLPLIDSGRAHRDLGWRPTRTGAQAVDDLLLGLRRGRRGPTPPLGCGPLTVPAPRSSAVPSTE